MKLRNLKFNMVINTIRGLLGIIFPIITFPYVSRILQVENLGKYNFAVSIINYFVLLASLGIPLYATRDGAKLRDNKKKLQQFADEIFTINVITMIFSYIILIVMIFFVDKLRDYKLILIILSLQMIFKTVGVEWIYSIFEDYVYITIRGIIFQIVSLVLLFLLVKDTDDYVIYAGITVFSSVGSNIINYIHAKKYCRIHLCRNIEWKKHLKPIFIFFATNIAITIYVSSDTTILGFMCGEYAVGIYSVAVKGYNIVKTILSSVITVAIPRLSALAGSEKREKNPIFIATAKDIYETVLSLTIPALVGIIILAKDIIIIIAGKSYLEATISLRMLSGALLFCMIGYYWGQCILYSVGKESFVLKGTIISAIVNIVLNFILVPFGSYNAAAFTTVISEALTAIMFLVEGSRYIQMRGIVYTLLKIIVGCIGIGFISLIIGQFKFPVIINATVIIVLAVIIYFIIEIILKNNALYSVTNLIKEKIHM